MNLSRKLIVAFEKRMESLHLLGVVVICCLLQQIRAADIYCPEISTSFTDDSPYKGLPLPQCPNDQGIVMIVYTRNNPTDGQPITKDYIPSVFNPSIMTIWIVHGWTQSENIPWMHTMKDAFLKQGSYNVIIVGWSKGADNLWYPQPASNTRAVGVAIALVVKHTVDEGGSSRQLQYCVGHSLGSHICGFAGKFGQIARITGLDPAGPVYDSMPLSAGLNPSCADFVDVIHTNGEKPLVFGIGTLRQCGHVDFYVNKGSQQPGCVDPFSGINLNGLITFQYNQVGLAIEANEACSHFRAYKYFTESILTPCFLTRYNCSNPYSLPDSCETHDQPIQSLGFNSIAYPARGIFHLTTNSLSPFCQN